MGCRITDVATVGKVSTCTVSRILNETAGFTFSSATVKRIRAVAGRMGYVADPASRAVRLGKTFSIAYVSEHALPAYSYFDAEIHAALGGGLMSQGYDLASYSPPKCRELLPVFEKKHDGVILSWTTDTRLRADLRRTGLPFVEMNAKSGATADCVDPADIEAGQMLGGLLGGMGYRRIIFLGERGKRDYVRERLQGIRAAVRGSGVQLEEIAGGAPRAIMGRLRALPEGERRRTALVQAGGIQMLQAIYYLAAGMGLEVPANFGMASCDVSAVPHSMEAKAISGTTYSVEDMAAAAVAMLLKKIGHPDRALPVDLVHHRLCAGDTLTPQDPGPCIADPARRRRGKRVCIV